MSIATISRYWSKQFKKMREDPSYWVNNRIVADWVHGLITDNAGGHWLPWFLHTYAGHRTFDHALSICCGDGWHEETMLTSGRVRHVTGFDLSDGAIEQARVRMRQAGISPDRHDFSVCDAEHFNTKQSFDLVLSAGALHHLQELETMLERIRSFLARDGLFVLVEYIGPNRFQWTDPQIQSINDILHSLDPKYLRSAERETFTRPSLKHMEETDPSEAIRSEEIRSLVHASFRVEYERFYNGTIIHQLHPFLNPALVNAGDTGFDAAVRAILTAEQELIDRHVLEPDFVFMICRNR